MRNLVQKEYNTKSKGGYRGQTIIFTNSRRKTHQIANYLNNKRVNAQAYHAGLSYYKKERIEKDFDKGKIACVVTTAALAAGVDFPASQVIFDSLVMGNKWINPNEFSQMLGRAGRPSYHDRGIVYLLPEIGNDFAGESETGCGGGFCVPEILRGESQRDRGQTEGLHPHVCQPLDDRG